MPMVVEAIACSADDARLVEKAGAHRMEVCSAISVGGLTPSVGAFRTIRANTRLPLMVMVRPRPGGFCYSKLEHAAMLEDIVALLDSGADGFVIASLKPDGTVDINRLKELIDAAKGKVVEFHRAFDAVPDPAEALEALIELDVNRLLTSGCAETAVQGIPVLRRLVAQSRDRIEILAGGGVRPGNVREIVEGAGVRQVHLGPFVQVADTSLKYSEASERLYGAAYSVADADTIAAAVAQLAKMS